MHDQTGGWAALGDGHLKRRTDQFGRHRRRHGPADDLAREEVHHRGQVQPAAARAQIGDVGHPGLVGTGGLELPVQHVARRGQAVPAVRRVDELALPFGKIRIGPKGSDGGHNGLKSIQETLNTNVYPRLRFGIGNEFSRGSQVNYVLDKWSDEELKTLDARIKIAADAVKAFAFIGLQRCMNEYNNK